MATYPIEVRRCRHIRTNGTQCGSPALKSEELCYYHAQNQPGPVELYLDGERYSDGQIILPVFEDALSIQTVIRQVVRLMLSRRIERKDAGLLLYALQIASGNLKAVQAEKAQPTHIVVDPETTPQTPLGMTPWSATGHGHDPEVPEVEDDQDEDQHDQNEEYDDEEYDEEYDDGQRAGSFQPAPFPTLYHRYCALTPDQKQQMQDKCQSQGLFTEYQFQSYLLDDNTDPLLLAMQRFADRNRQPHPENSRTPDGVDPAPESTTCTSKSPAQSPAGTPRKTSDSA